MLRNWKRIAVLVLVSVVAGTVAFSQADEKLRNELLRAKKSLAQQAFVGRDHPRSRRFQEQIEQIDKALADLVARQLAEAREVLGDASNLPTGRECQVRVGNETIAVGKLVSLDETWLVLDGEDGEHWIPRERVEHLVFPK